MNTDRFALLTRRHRECLRLVHERRVSKEIATDLGLSVGTVHTYIKEAIHILGAANRRQASEMFAVYEAAADPHKVEPTSVGVEPEPILQPVTAPSSAPSIPRLLPLRAKGATGNDLSLVTRVAWIPVLAFAFAIAFGALASGLRVISDIFRSIGAS